MTKKQRKANRSWYLHNKEKVIVNSRKYYHLNKEKILVRQKKYAKRNRKQRAKTNKIWASRNKKRLAHLHARWHKANPHKTREYALKAKYGITLDQYDGMVKKQDGKCAICFRIRKLVVDHDHKTGKMRKLLCAACNTRLGWFENSQTIILKYLKGLTF